MAARLRCFVESAGSVGRDHALAGAGGSNGAPRDSVRVTALSGLLLALVRARGQVVRGGIPCITTLARASVHERDIMRHSRHDVRAAAAEEAFTSGALWRHKDG